MVTVTDDGGTMLTTQENERLTRVGPGTDMGRLMRRYWQPVVGVERLDNEKVLKVTLLGEELTLFQDLEGNLGLVGAKCAHRCVDMSLGIPARNGLRCPYHGWLYGQDGACIETPLESAHSQLRERVHIPAYPVLSYAGLVWTYMGELPAPELPRWDIFEYQGAIRQIGYAILPCNWLQCQENAADPAHNVYLHGDFFRYALEREGTLGERTLAIGEHRSSASTKSGLGFSHVVSEVARYGIRKGMAYTEARGARENITRWFPYLVFPNYTRVGGGAGLRHDLQMRVPIDDTHTLHIMYDIYPVPPGIEIAPQRSIPWYEVPVFDDEGKPILDFVLAQDHVAWYSQGPIVDRSRECLGGTDEAVQRFRDLLFVELDRSEMGLDTMNVFRRGRDDEADALTIELEPPIGRKIAKEVLEVNQSGQFRNLYHHGYYLDDHDRYGPALPLVLEMMQKAEEQVGVDRLVDARVLPS